MLLISNNENTFSKLFLIIFIETMFKLKNNYWNNNIE